MRSIEFLLNNGANPNIENRPQQTALDILDNIDPDEDLKNQIEEILVQYGAIHAPSLISKETMTFIRGILFGAMGTAGIFYLYERFKKSD